jgi:hypothetical protein|tara:strand:- start:103 stop:720 length:618 start_codon:yes stop_codon:yes gene_type:complete
MGVISNGTTLLDAGALDSGIATGDMVLIKTLTASNSATLTFHNGASSVVLDSTYKKYIFTFINCHPITNDVTLQFQANVVDASGFNETVTSVFFQTRHGEDDSQKNIGATANRDQAQGTGFQTLNYDVANDNDAGVCGSLTIFDPSNTTFVKHFISRASNYGQGDEAADCFVAGYFNTTSAIDEIQFKVSSGNIDSGTIKLYGIK